MLKKGEYHIPALLKEAIDLLEVKPGEKYIDATLGGGGHSLEIVKRGGFLLGIDQDPEAIEYASRRIAQACPDLQPPKFALGNFSLIDKLATEFGFDQVGGILFDLGVSSHQLEASHRGFSFNQPGPLDMRMSPSLSITAKELVNGLNEGELAELFFKLGEEKFSKRFARAICRAREVGPIETCDELAKIIVSKAPPRGKFDRTHPATRVFQALRIAVNDELNSLREALPKAVDLLKPGARLVVLSFHSLEDGIVKNYLEEEEVLKIITPKPIVPTREESEANPRARSAKLRAAEKL